MNNILMIVLATIFGIAAVKALLLEFVIILITIAEVSLVNSRDDFKRMWWKLILAISAVIGIPVITYLSMRYVWRFLITSHSVLSIADFIYLSLSLVWIFIMLFAKFKSKDSNEDFGI